MNIEQAKAIALTEILTRLKLTAVKENEKEARYLSPFRYELTGSFYVDKTRNTCFDFGSYKGGNAFDFVQQLLKSNGDDFSEENTLRCLQEMTSGLDSFEISRLIKEKQPVWLVKDVDTVTEPALVHYLENRGIPFSIGCEVFRQVVVHHSHLDLGIVALGIENDDEGYELCNPNFNGCAGARTISFIRGTYGDHTKLCIFQNAMDYATFLTTRDNRPHEEDVFILHAPGYSSHVPDHIKGLGYKEAYLPG
jgi:hypothetical protein